MRKLEITADGNGDEIIVGIKDVGEEPLSRYDRISMPAALIAYCIDDHVRLFPDEGDALANAIVKMGQAQLAQKTKEG